MSIKCAKSHSFDRRSQNVSQNIFPHKILPLLCDRIEARASVLPHKSSVHCL